MGLKQERLLWLMLLGIAAFNKADFLLTLDALDGGFIEANPLLAPMVGTVYFPLVKLLLLPFLLLVLWKIRGRVGERLLKYVSLPFAMYFSLMVYFRSILPF